MVIAATRTDRPMNASPKQTMVCTSLHEYVDISSFIVMFLAMKYTDQSNHFAMALASLGHEARLSVYRLLVRAGNAGLNVGEIGEELDLPASTLSHHLRALVHAGLVIQEKRGREVFNRPDFDAMTNLTAFLTEECCVGIEIKAEVA